MNRQAVWAIGLLIVATGIAGLLVLLRPEPEAVEPVVAVPLVETAQYAVSTGALEVLGSGTVQPRDEVALGAQISGRLVYVNPSLREGGSVGQGEVLFRVEAADYQNQLRSAQADVAAQDVAVLQARQEVAIAQRELERFASRETSRSALSRTVDANDYAARILPPEGLGVPENTASVAAPEASNLATREPQLRSARAARDRARAQLADARLALSRTAVRAPFSGLVRSEDVAIGTLVQPGQSLATIVARDVFEVRVSLTADEAALIPGLFAAQRSNIPSSVEMEYGGRMWRWPATVDRADPILDPETRTIDVFLRVANPMRGGLLVGDQGDAGAPPPLLLGSFVNAAISASVPRPFAAIPLDALREGDNVWLLANGKLQIVQVDVIQRTDRMAYVSGEGLGQGGHVVVSNLRTPVAGMALRSEAANTAGAGTPAGE